MPELRYNLLTRDWIIIATDRAKRPEDFAGKPAPVADASAANCPFCPGREAKTPPEIFAFRDPGTQPNTPGWQVRVTRNAFPALAPEGELTKTKTPAGFFKMNGVGAHEVIIETPEHDKVIATMEQAQVDKIFLAYKERFSSLARDPRFQSVILFKNHGRGAGTSLSHPHSQIIALPIVPDVLRNRLNTCREHTAETKCCLYCDLIKMEKSEGERIIEESANFVVFVPFAARMPFEMWVMPKFHNPNFQEITTEQCLELAAIVKKTLEKLYRAVGNPSFNYAIYSAPVKEHDVSYFHWNLKIFPRVAMAAGFEVGSGVMINTVVPEMAAKYLREA